MYAIFFIEPFVFSIITDNHFIKSRFFSWKCYDAIYIIVCNDTTIAKFADIQDNFVFYVLFVF